MVYDVTNGAKSCMEEEEMNESSGIGKQRAGSVSADYETNEGASAAACATYMKC